jgi:hypothetical protein
MERAGFDVPAYEKLRRLGLQFDFYLSHEIGDRAYDPNWRLYIPKGL